jgi:hypothetical protein
MTTVTWDQAGKRRFESGVDRGVLYIPSNGISPAVAVPWNGLVSITENTERELKSYFLDGIKYLDHVIPSAYSAKLAAFTYPDEFEEVIGKSKFVPGVYVHDQRSKLFGLTYRTKLSNDLDADAGYRIHLVYNLTAVPSSVALSSLSNSPAVGVFEWSLTGVPPSMSGIRPTSHISIDTTLIDPDLLDQIEQMIYGTLAEDPVLPDMIDLLTLMEGP